jgi:sugar O-acyltransferase (sialic acid O-acetyltransferase NeuD family)
MKDKDLYIFGGKSTALEIYETSISLQIYSKVYFVVSDLENLDENNIIKESDLFKTINNNAKSYFIVSMSDLIIKKKCIELAKKLKLELTSIVHPAAFLSSTSFIGKGVYVAANSIVSNNAIIEDNCLINYSVIIGHDSRVKKNCTINPGVVIGGNSIIGENVLVGANSVIKQDIEISDDSKIDAMTYVYFNIEKPSACTSRNIKVITLKN